VLTTAYANLLRGNYTNGPFSASLVSGRELKVGKTTPLQGELLAAAAQPADTKEWGIGADYDFGMVKIYGTYQDRDTDTAKAAVPVVSLPTMATSGPLVLRFRSSRSAASCSPMPTLIRTRTAWDADAWTLAYYP
jgi:hypothetical protein